jgi:hypothetical protein
MERITQVVKQAKGLYSWYTFGSAIVGKLGLGGLFAAGAALIVGVPAAIIKGVPWPITLMAGVSILIAVACLAATPLIIRLAIEAMRPVPEPNKAPQPIRPHWDAYKHYDKFTVRQAACLLEDLEPSTRSHNPKVEARIGALCAAIRKGELKFILNTEELGGYHMPLDPLDARKALTKRQMENPDANTEIPKGALMDFAKLNNIDLKYLGQ